MKYFFLGLMLLISMLCHAGHEGGGGDAVTLPDGSIVLADVFLDRNQPQPDNMPRRMSLNPKLLLQLKVYHEFLKRQLYATRLLQETKCDYPTCTTQTTEKVPDVLNLTEILGKRENDLIFYSVQNEQELNTYCASGGRKVYKLPEGHSVTQVACTSGNAVFLVEPIFRRMSILQQSLLLMHERMTTLTDEFGGKNYAAISGVTTGLGEILRIAFEQQQGKYRQLSETEVARIRFFYEGMVELEYRSSEIPENALDWNIHKHGGGFISGKNEVPNFPFISVTSSLGEKVVVGKDSRIIDSTVLGKATLGESNFIKNSFIYGTILTTGTNFKMSNSGIHTQKKVVEINDNQKIENGFMTNELFDYLPEGYELEHVALSTANIPSKCQAPLKKMNRSNALKECFHENNPYIFDGFIEWVILKRIPNFNLNQVIEKTKKKAALRSYQFSYATVKEVPGAKEFYARFEKNIYANYEGNIGVAVDSLKRNIKVPEPKISIFSETYKYSVEVAKAWSLATRMMLLEEFTRNGIEAKITGEDIQVLLKVKPVEISGL